LGFVGISHAAIRQWRLLLIGAIGLVLVASMALQRIPRREEPLVEPPVVQVLIPYLGASAEDVDALVIQPVEEELFAMDGIDFIVSKALPNYAQIFMRFEYGTPMDPVTETVRGKVLGKRKELPNEVGDPIVLRVKMSTYLANMVVAVAGNRADGVLTDTAKSLKDALVGVPGVASVTLRGARERAVRVRLDPVRLAANHLSVEQVTARIKLANVRIPGGEVPVGSLLTLLSVSHEMKDAADVAKIPVGASTDLSGATRTVSLGDVAEIRDDFRKATERMVQDGVPAVGLEVRFRPGENGVQVGERVRRQIEAERASLPKGVEIAIAHDQPEWVRDSLSTFIESLEEGVLLVMLIVTLGMGWRSAVVVAMVLPLAMAGALVGLYSMGFALDQVSLGGLIVGLGLLVDDAIVVTESIQLMRDRGLSGVRSAVLGTARVFWANNGTTAVACASFVPLFFMGGDIGAFTRGLPTAVILALVTSLVVAQLLTPWISTFFLKSAGNIAPIPDEVPFDRRQDSQHEERNVALRALKAAYRRFIPRVVEHPLAVVAIATAMLVGSCFLLVKIGVQFFPKTDNPALFVGVQLPRGTDESTTAAKVVQVARELRSDPAVQSTSAVVGGGYPAVVTGHAVHESSKDYGELLVRLATPSTGDITRRLRTRLAAVPGAKVTLDELYYGPPVPHPITVRVQGDDYTKLRRYADDITARLREVPGAINVADSMSDSIPIANVEVDADRALRFGVTPGQIGSTLRTVNGEDEVTSFRQKRDTVQIIIEGAAVGPNALDRVEQTPVPTIAGAPVPLLAVGEVNVVRSFAELGRRNTHHLVEVTADVEGGTLPATVLAQIKPTLDAIQWEKGYAYSFGGEKAETEKSFRNLGIAAMITLLIIFVLLVLMFGNFTHAIIVLAAVPYALIGALTGLYVTNNAFGFMAFLGLVALIGVYVNHKIYFVDRMNELIGRGLDWRSAIFQAGIDRIRPVVLTALTAILGLLPLTLGARTVFSPFGWVNVFGLVVSIPLSLVLLPALLALSFRTKRRAEVSQELTTEPVVALPEHPSFGESNS
jgi:multidrug efflux pump subunit AcrB